MADSSFGANPITLDLTIASARTIIPAGTRIQVTSVQITGTAHATLAGDIVFRQDSASGQIVFEHKVAATTNKDTSLPNFWDFGKDPVPFNGLFMDALAGAYLAGGRLFIHYR